MPSSFRKDIFTVVAKENVDFNSTSSMAMKHFHGTSTAVMQFLSHNNVGNESAIPENTQVPAK